MADDREPTPAQQAIDATNPYFAVIDREHQHVAFGRLLGDTATVNERFVLLTSPHGTTRTIVHTADMVPLTAAHYQTARSVEWDANELARTPDGRQALVAVHTNTAWDGDRT